MLPAAIPCRVERLRKSELLLQFLDLRPERAVRPQLVAVAAVLADEKIAVRPWLFLYGRDRALGGPRIFCLPLVGAVVSNHFRFAGSV